MEVTIKPTLKQFECWKYLQDEETSYILFGGGAGSGKSYLSGSWLFFMASTFAGTRYFIGRSELKSIRSSWLQTFYKVVRDSGLDPATLFKFNAQDNFLLFNNGSRIDFLDLSEQPADPFFESLGSYEFTGGALEECGEISEAAFDVLKARVNRCLNDKYNITAKILMTCNPKKNFLYYQFYKPFKEGTLAKGYAVVLAVAKDNPNMPGYTDQLMQITDKSQRERLLGNWDYDLLVQGLIEYQAIMDAFGGAVNMKVQRGEHFISADVARYGSDSTVIILWSGKRIERIQMFQKLSIPEVVKKISDLKDSYSVPVSNVVIDQDGVGGGACDGLPGCKQFVNNGKALELNGEVQNFANLKTQCYVKLAELMNEREIFINCDTPTIKSDLVQELEQVRLKDQEGRLAVISKAEVKETIGRSPDLSDALMMRMVFELQPSSDGPFIQTFRYSSNVSFNDNDQSRSDEYSKSIFNF